MGARIVQIARDRKRGEAAMKRLGEVAPAVSHSIHYADLSKLGAMKRVSAAILATEPRIDVLINNAGAIFGKLEVTEDGLERTFALNHMSYFVITCELLERLKDSAPARIVSTSSDAHEVAKLDFNDLQSKSVYASGTFGQWLRYCGERRGNTGLSCVFAGCSRGEWRLLSGLSSRSVECRSYRQRRGGTALGCERKNCRTH